MREINGFTAEFRQEINVRLFFCTLMTNNRGLVNLRILGIMIIAVSILLVTTGTQNAMATAAIIVEEAAEAEAGNATMTAAENQTANGNMTGTNSTG